jgi:hypothetical protein
MDNPDPDGRAARHKVGRMNISFNGKGCSYIEQMASVLQHIELANQEVYRMVVLTKK